MQKEVEKYGTKLWAECSEFRFVDRDEVEGYGADNRLFDGRQQPLLPNLTFF